MFIRKKANREALRQNYLKSNQNLEIGFKGAESDDTSELEESDFEELSMADVETGNQSRITSNYQSIVGAPPMNTTNFMESTPSSPYEPPAQSKPQMPVHTASIA